MKEEMLRYEITLGFPFLHNVMCCLPRAAGLPSRGPSSPGDVLGDSQFDKSVVGVCVGWTPAGWAGTVEREEVAAATLALVAWPLHTPPPTTKCSMVSGTVLHQRPPDSHRRHI